MSSAIPKGSTVLVTGINGFIASYIASELIQAGYIVRGTARSLEKGDVIKAALEKKHGSSATVQIRVVEGMEDEGAFDEAVKGVSGIIHVASVVSFDTNPNNVIPQVVSGIRGILNSAEKEPSVKRFVYTSSSSAATSPKPNEKFTITKDTWNEEDVKAAWMPPPYEPARAWYNYAASKTQAEQELWKWAREQKPHFVVNAVLPNTNIGPLFYPTQFGSTTNWALDIYKGKSDFLPDAPPQYFIDVRDTAKLHVVALINPDVQNERVFAFAEPYTRHQFFTIIKEARPNAKLAVVPESQDRDLSEVAERPRAVALLGWFGRDNFTSLKESINDTLDACDSSS